jgi:hypothetical protein
MTLPSLESVAMHDAEQLLDELMEGPAAHRLTTLLLRTHSRSCLTFYPFEYVQEGTVEYPAASGTHLPVKRESAADWINFSLALSEAAMSAVKAGPLLMPEKLKANSALAEAPRKLLPPRYVVVRATGGIMLLCKQGHRVLREFRAHIKAGRATANCVRMLDPRTVCRQKGTHIASLLDRGCLVLYNAPFPCTPEQVVDAVVEGDKSPLWPLWVWEHWQEE